MFIQRKTVNHYADLGLFRRCWSYVGRKGGEQKVSIGPGCEYMGTIIHEIGHAVGFWHEQSRQDRDHYIRIQKENIQTNAMDQFSKSMLYFLSSGPKKFHPRHVLAVFLKESCIFKPRSYK